MYIRVYNVGPTLAHQRRFLYMEASNKGTDRSAAQSNSQTKEWFLLHIYEVYQGRISLHIQAKDNPANSLDQRMNRRVHAFV